jgi:2-dehydropantoate 2-reductase
MEQPIYILGLGNLGKYVAYALGRSHGSRLPTRLLFHRLALLDEWKAAGRSIRCSAHFSHSGPDTEYPPATGFREELTSPAVTEDKQTIGRRHPHVEIASMTPITYLIMATKAHATIPALAPIKDRLTRDSHILFLQNGMGRCISTRSMDRCADLN